MVVLVTWFWQTEWEAEFKSNAVVFFVWVGIFMSLMDFFCYYIPCSLGDLLAFLIDGTEEVSGCKIFFRLLAS